MGPLIYSLCHKPVLGLMLYITTACAFPPLFHAEPLPLRQVGTTIVKEFEAPVGKPYSLLLVFQFPSPAAIRADEIAGSRYDANCRRDYSDIPEPQRAGLGRPIPFHVLIREKKTGTVALDRVFNSLCLTSSSGNGHEKSRTVARFDLAAGAYVAEIRNMQSQPGLDDVTTTMSLVSGDAK